MTQEQIKAKAKGYFPNDEFKQQAVIDAINWATKELQKENAELKEKLKPENCLKSLAKSGLVKFTCENRNEHDQLTKAKQFIRDFLSVAIDYIDKEDKNYSLIAEAEQFISEVEK